MNKKKVTILSLTSLSALSVGTLMFSAFKPTQKVLENNATDTITLSVTSMTSSSLVLSNGYTVSISSSGFSAGDNDNLCSIAAGGYFMVNDINNHIRGIHNISVTTEGCYVQIVRCFYDYEDNEVYEDDDGWGTAAQNPTADYSSAPVDFFKIYVTGSEGSSYIKSVSFQVDKECETSSYSFEANFTPNWNSRTSETPADIYIAGTSELIDGTTSNNWSYAKLTYDSTTHKYSFTNNSVAPGCYTYALYAIENGEVFNWNGRSLDGNQYIKLNGNVTDTTSYEWDYEPGYVAQTNYTINFVLNLGYNDNITWVGLDYAKDSATTGTVRSESTSTELEMTTNASTSTATISNIDYEGSVCFWFKAWNSVLDGNTNIVADATWATGGYITLRYIPTSCQDVTVTIDVSSYDSSDWTYVYSGATVTPSVGVVTPSNVDPAPSGEMSFPNQTTTVYGNKITITPSFSGTSESFTASYEGENIRIDDNLYITGLKAGTTTKVTLTSQSGLTCDFDVTIPNSTYVANNDSSWSGGSEPISTSEKWFTSNKVSEISGLYSDFYNGIDVSSAKALYDNGSKFYNSDGVEQSLFYILKDAGVNWIRLKLWVDPKTSNGASYGGGESNLTNTIWMAYEAKAAGMKVLLDFHYSDYWTHPGQQIIPKSWNSCNSASSLQAQLKSYTTQTLTSFENAHCLPDMVQLGNEISSGIFLQKYTGGASDIIGSDGRPSYLTNYSSYSYGTTNPAQFTNYIKAASEGVDAVDSSIKKVLHWASGGSGTSASVINSFFSNMPSAYYDYAAISFYPYYCFNSMNEAHNILSGLSLSKPWFVAETSYPFTVGWPEHVSTNFTISGSNAGNTSISSSYSFSPRGQADLIHDLTSEVVSNGGKGIFYWESAWIPNSNVGWAGSGSKNTWGNQGFFSFDGKAIANLDLFKQMSPSI